jgi:hypothetical protein
MSATELIIAAITEPADLNKQREMIKSAVNVAANGVLETIKLLRAEIDDLERLVLQNGARVTEDLNTHVSICENAQKEVDRLHGVVAGMRKSQIDGQDERQGHLNGNGASGA